jgi:hypothetical protein
MSGSSAPAASAADWRVPSRVRGFRIYSGQNSLSPTRAPNPLLYKWPPKHPLDIEWWWVNATGWCEDIGDIINSFAASDVLISGGDGALSLVGTSISADGNQVGMRWIGGTSGQIYTVTVMLRGSQGADAEAFDISFPCNGVLPSSLGTPWFADYSSAANSGAYLFL